MSMMKRYFTICLLLVCIGTPTMAQEDSTRTNADEVKALREEIEMLKKKQEQSERAEKRSERQESMWPKSAPWLITCGNQTLEDKSLGVKYKSDLSFSFSTRKTYDLHKKAIGGMLKFGLDLTWLDINVTRYEKGKGLSMESLSTDLLGNVTSGMFNSFEDYFNAADKQALSGNLDDMDIIDIMNRIDVGKFQVSANILAIGPNIRVAPFYPIGLKWLDKIKIGVYAHYVPTYSALILTEKESDPVVCGGYMSCWRFGANLTIGRIGIGVEHEMGDGTLKKWNFNSDSDDKVNVTTDKVDYSMYGSRLYIGVKF